MSTPKPQHREEIPKNDKKLVQWWRERIDLGIKWRWRTSGKDDKRWIRYKNYYRGDWGTDYEIEAGVASIDEYLPTNRIFAYIKSVVPRIYFRNPGIVITKGVERDKQDDSRIVQDVGNYLSKELGLKGTMKRVVLNTMLLGTGVLKDGFGSQFVSGVKAQEANDKRVLEHAVNIKPGLPWTQMVDSSNFVVPWGTKLFKDAPWCAHGVWRPLEYAQDDKNYINRTSFIGKKIPKNLGGLSGSGDPTLIVEEESGLWVRLWEIHDRATGAIFIISDGSLNLHYKGDDILQIEGLPFHVLVFDEDPDTMWGISSVKIAEPQQLELNDVRTMESKYRKRDFTKILVDPSVSDPAIAALNDASDPLAAVKVPDPNKNVKVITTNMPRDLPQAGEEADNDLKFSIGFGRNQGGEVSTGRRTAREIEVVRQAAEMRNDERRDAAADLYAGVMNSILQISFLLMDDSLVKEIAGAVWHSRDADRLPYDLGLEVHPEESRPVSASVQRAEAVELYDRLMRNPLVNPLVPLFLLLEAYPQVDPEEAIDPEMARAVALVLQMREKQGKQGERGERA